MTMPAAPNRHWPPPHPPALEMAEPERVREWLKDLRGDRKQEDVERETAAFGPEFRVTQSYLSKIERGHKSLAGLGPQRMDALRRVYRVTLEDWLSHTGYDIVTRENAADRPKRVTNDVRRAGDEAEQAFAREGGRLMTVQYLSSGAGPNFSDSDVEGVAELPYSDFMQRYPNGRYLKVQGDCMEPDYPAGWFIAVIPDPALATPGSAVLVWFAGDGRKLKYLVQSREDGDHVLLQTNPPEGERHLVRAPIGSRVLGVIYECVPEFRQKAPTRMSRRQMVEMITDEEPELLDDLDL